MGFVIALGALLILLYLFAAVLRIGTGIDVHWPALIWRGGGMILILVIWWITHQNRIFKYRK